MIKINIFGIVSTIEKPLNHKFEIDITNDNIESIKHKVSNKIDTFSWIMPKRYILDSIQTNLDNYLKAKVEPKERVIKSVFSKPKSKPKNSNNQLSLFDL